MSARFVRLAETERARLRFMVDGVAAEGRQGDTLLVAMLCSGRTLRRHEFDGAERSGFCLMAACQDCWVWTEDGERLRACDTPLVEGLRIVTRPPAATWANRA